MSEPIDVPKEPQDVPKDTEDWEKWVNALTKVREEYNEKNRGAPDFVPAP
ncbi:hypothetical protein JW988_03825 [Candidatus Bathyarchaeota archaeon]|nr:hypothetical protein [Candidatus Bathyarchaeota archaeon]